MSRPLRLLGFVLVCALGACLLGCPAKLPPGATALDKMRVDTTDTHEVDEDGVIASMASDPTHRTLGLVRFWWQDYGVYDRVELEKDLHRIERYYRARGYYEAHVRAGRVMQTGEREVRVQIVVEEGPAVKVGKVVAIGLDPLPADVQQALKDVWTLSPGEVFDEAEYHKAASEAERVLTDQGYAYAAVRLGAEVDLLTHQAIIHVEFVPGVRCTFGEYEIEGLSALSEPAVRKIVAIAPGDRYSTKTIRDTQHALFDLQVFDSALITPDLSDPNRTVVPFKIVITESKLKRVKVGPGFLLDPLRNDLHFVASWEHHNFLGGPGGKHGWPISLRTFKVEVRPLLMFKPGFFSTKQIRPGIGTGAELRQPSFFEPRLTGVVAAQTGILPDPINDFRIFTNRASLGVDRRFGPLLYAGFFYRKGIDVVTAYSPSLLPANACHDENFVARTQCTTQIGYFELLASIDARDDLLEPRKGYYAALSLQWAMATKAFYGGDFADLRVQPEVRLFGPILKGLTLAFRFMTGFVLPRNYDPHYPDKRTPTADDPSRFSQETVGDTPLWRAFFSGGATSNRGYPTRSIGLRDCNRDATGAPTEAGQDCSIVVGGASIFETNLELRFDIVGALTGVWFLDAADVSRSVFDIRLDHPHLSTGPGVRYLTPIGPVRLDFGYRIPGAQRLGGPLDPREEPKEFSLGFKGPFALHLSIGEAF